MGRRVSVAVVAVAMAMAGKEGEKGGGASERGLRKVREGAAGAERRVARCGTPTVTLRRLETYPQSTVRAS